MAERAKNNIALSTPDNYSHWVSLLRQMDLRIEVVSFTTDHGTDAHLNLKMMVTAKPKNNQLRKSIAVMSCDA